MLTTDNREHFKDYSATAPHFGTAPQALLQGFTDMPGVEIHVLSCTQGAMQSPEKIAGNIWFHSLHVPKIGWLRTLYQGCIRAVRAKLKDLQPEIVHGQGTERDCAISAVLSGFPNVVTIHGNMAEQARLFQARVGSYTWLAAHLENFTLRRTMGVFCNSAYTRSLVRPRAKQTWEVPNALRSQFFDRPIQHPASANGALILCVGAIIPRKRQLEILDVAESLWRQGHKPSFQFIGRADPANPYAARFFERLKQLQTHCGLSYSAEIGTDELIDRFDNASALIHFPSEEAFGLVVAEALARNLKFFGARLGGITDIAEGVPGAELFDQNDWRGLTEAVSRWLSEGCACAVGAAKIMKKRFHSQVVARHHVEIYQQVLSHAVEAPLM